MTDDGRLPDEIAARYRIGPRLQAAWESVFSAPMVGLVSATPGSTDEFWADFSLSANLRGEHIAWQVARRATRGWPTLRGLRVLDVGTGLGGAAVGCRALGAEVTAIDVDPNLLSLARANAADQGAEISFLEVGLAEAPARGLGGFDAVIAEDVLEHVPDASVGVAVLSELATPGGLVMTTIPNGDAAHHVVADGHYLLAGITLLRERPHAEWYFKERFSDGVYDVGNYHTWDAYRSWFLEAGLDLAQVEDLYSSEDQLDVQLEIAREAVDEVIADSSLPSELRNQIAAGWRAYETRFDATLQMSDPERRRRVEAVAWRVFATKGRHRRRFRSYGPSAPSPECWRELGRRVPGLVPLYRRLRGR